MDLDTIKANAANPELRGAAIRQLVLGLMRGHRPSLKLGYSFENARLAAMDVLDCSEGEVDAQFVASVTGDDFVSFLHYLHGDCLLEPLDLIYAVERPHKYRDHYARFLAQLDRDAYPAAA